MIIKKFGGTSLKDLKCIEDVAKDIFKTKEKQIIVVSAPSGFTNKILSDAYSLSEKPSLREIDQMIITGEMINASLLAISLDNLGLKAISQNALSLNIEVSLDYGDANILQIDKNKLDSLLLEYDVIVVTGFQGIKETEFLSLGRGGSDTTALAIASLYDLPCYIYTDVAGVYLVDPRTMNEVFPYEDISLSDMLEFSLAGNKVLAPKAAQLAFDKKIPTTILKSLTNKGTDILPIETRGIRGIEIIDNISISNTFEKNSLLYFLDNEEVTSIKKEKSSEYSLFTIIGSFLIKTKIYEKVLVILKKYEIKKAIIKENYMALIIPSIYKNIILDNLLNNIKELNENIEI